MGPCYLCDEPPVGMFRIRGLLLELPVCQGHATAIEQFSFRIDYRISR